MFIREVELKGFGKFHDKVVSFGEGINIISGGNESGKSTLYAFIQAMFFGIERGRGRASKEDTYNRYIPWEQKGVYGGSLDFGWNGKYYRIQRDFTVKGKTADFYDMETGESRPALDEATYLASGLTLSNFKNTVSVGASGFVTEAGFAGTIQDSILNLSTGQDGSIAVSAALRYLMEEKKRLETTNTGRHMEESALARQEMSKLEREAENCGMQLAELRRSCEVLLQEIQEAEKESWSEPEPQYYDTVETPVGRNYAVGVLGIAALAAAAAVTMFSGMRPLPSILAWLAAAGGCVGAFIYYSVRRSVRNKNKEMYNNYDKEEEDEAASEERVHLFERQWAEYGKMQEECGRLSAVLSNMERKMEELQELGDSYEEWRMKKIKEQEDVSALTKAAELLQEISEEIRSDFGPRFAKELGRAAGKLTCGEYSRVFIDENLQMKLQKNRDIYPLSRFSRGTSEQIGLALRLAAAKVLFSGRTFPLILDDALVNFDQGRLRASLRYLSEEMGQVLLFTCSEREAEELDQLGIPYRFFSLTEELPEV